MPATRTEIGPPAACTCTDSDSGILTGPKSFAQVASLPTATGETISFQPGHTPKAKGSATVTSTATDGQLTTMTEPLATSTATAPSTASGDPGLSKGAKAGIGVGVAALGMAVVLLMAFLFVRCHRIHSKKQPPGEKTAYHPAAPGPDMAQSPPPQYGSPGILYNPPPPPPHHDVSAFGYPGYTGFKSELPAVPVESKSASGFTSELPADNGISTSRHGLDRNATPSMLSMPGSPGHHSMVSGISRAPSVAPSMHSSQGDAYMRYSVSGDMAPIAELHG
ncbi:hypothetical protein INS49_009650 [Diaporthe citri]|uniref:uncharacterized protein n=1 Tax=Diaporthe citri TaxID=83186 RepID=UPI001C7F3B7B|nr:uncharacterized protein INS49_009650 [Diaporthe citri]KAG6361423.1 hypothetical protein INS49_009650 [Diaporthe citri]